DVLLNDLVVGDIVYLNTGDSIPADGVVLSSQMLVVNEAILTGESRPVDKSSYKLKDVQNLDQILGGEVHDKYAKHWVFMGTSVSAGIGKMLVTRTGNHTQMGKIAKSLTTTEDEQTPLQVQLNKLARSLMIIVVAITIFIFP